MNPELIEEAKGEINILHLCVEGVLARADDEVIQGLLLQLNKVLDKLEPLFTANERMLLKRRHQISREDISRHRHRRRSELEDDDDL